MKRVLSSTMQIFKQIKSDPMMFAACFTPFVMGALIKFGIPFLERITDCSLQEYYPIFDLLLSIMAPVLLCFAFAMITLEEIDDKVSRYFSITPLGKSGYLFTRLGVPSIISAVIAFIVLLLFSLEKLSIGMTICLALLGSVQAIIVSLMIITLSSNKLEGMSNVHMAWTRAVCGRLKSDYSYSNMIVYNNFPWPSPTNDQKEKIRKTAQAILNARALYTDSNLADLYDPLTMPTELLKAHKANNRAVMHAYGFSIKMSEADCVAELMRMYQKLTKEK